MHPLYEGIGPSYHRRGDRNLTEAVLAKTAATMLSKMAKEQGLTGSSGRGGRPVHTGQAMPPRAEVRTRVRASEEEIREEAQPVPRGSR